MHKYLPIFNCNEYQLTIHSPSALQEQRTVSSLLLHLFQLCYSSKVEKDPAERGISFFFSSGREVIPPLTWLPTTEGKQDAKEELNLWFPVHPPQLSKLSSWVSKHTSLESNIRAGKDSISIWKMDQYFWSEQVVLRKKQNKTNK